MPCPGLNIKTPNLTKTMKAVFIVFNQANVERVEYLLDKLEIRGFTWFSQVEGRGSKTGDPHRGTHTWPEVNSAVLAVVDDGRVSEILDKVRRLDQVNEEVGIRAFVWGVEQTV